MSAPAGPPPYEERGRQRPASPGWRIGSLRGTPVYLGRSWPVLAVVVVLTWGPLYPSLGGLSYLVAVGYLLLLLVSVLAHEAAHALVAQAFGHQVHQVVADLMGGHTSFQTADNAPGRSALVAVVGPAANAALALVCWPLLGVVPRGVGHLLLTAFVVANLGVTVLNLLPGLPLDGGFVLEALVWKLTGRRSTGLLVAGWTGRLLVVPIVGYLLVRPLLEGLSPDLVSLAWGVLVATFLWAGAGAAIRSGQARRLLDRVQVGPLLHPVRLLPAAATVAAAERAYGEGAHAVAVADETGCPTALVDPRVLATVPEAHRAATPVTAVAARQPDGWLVATAPSEPVTGALERMAQLGCGTVLVALPEGGLALLDGAEAEAAAQARTAAAAPRRPA